MVAELIDLVAAWLWTFAVHGTLIGLLAVVVARSRRRSPAQEEAVWRYAMLSGLVTATLQFAMKDADLAPLRFEVGSTSPVVVSVPETSSRTLSDSPSPELAEPLQIASEGDRLASWSEVGTLGAAILALFGLTRLGFRRLSLRRVLARRTRLAPDHPLHVTLDRLRERAGIARRVRLSVRPGAGSPFALGVWCPEICVPERALCMEANWRDAMLAHELEHLARRDPLWLDLGHALRALFPWQPVLAFAQRRMRHLAERRCDAAAARIVGALPVAECLVEVAGWMTGAERRTARHFPAMAVEREGLRLRVESLLDDGVHDVLRPHPVRVAAVVVAATALFAVTLPGASVAAGAISQPERVVPPPAPTVEAVTAPDPLASGSPRVAELLGLLADCDAERDALARRVGALRARVAGRSDASIQATLTSIEARLASIRRLRDRISARVQRLASPGATTALPSSVSNPVRTASDR